MHGTRAIAAANFGDQVALARHTAAAMPLQTFAAGDVARFPVRALGTTMRIEHEDHANSHGKAVGANMCLGARAAGAVLARTASR